MKGIKKIGKKPGLSCLIPVLLLASVLAFPGSADAADADTRMLSIGIGNFYGYNLNTDDLGTAQELSIGFGLADNLDACFHFITGDGVGGNFPSYNLFSLSYAVTPRMGMNIYGGSRVSAPIGAATGLGYYFNLFRKDFQDAMTTLLKLRVEYLISEGIAPEEGLLNIGLQGKIAF